MTTPSTCRPKGQFDGDWQSPLSKHRTERRAKRAASTREGLGGPFPRSPVRKVLMIVVPVGEMLPATACICSQRPTARGPGGVADARKKSHDTRKLSTQGVTRVRRRR